MDTSGFVPSQTEAVALGGGLVGWPRSGVLGSCLGVGVVCWVLGGWAVRVLVVWRIGPSVRLPGFALCGGARAR